MKPAYDDATLYLRFDVQDLSPWHNAGRDFARLFKTGDAVDLQLIARPQVKPHREPAAGDVRLLIAPWQAKPVTVLMVPVDPKAPAAGGKSYTSPVGTKHFDRVELLAAAGRHPRGRFALPRGSGDSFGGDRAPAHARHELPRRRRFHFPRMSKD